MYPDLFGNRLLKLLSSLTYLGAIHSESLFYGMKWSYFMVWNGLWSLNLCKALRILIL